MKRPVYFPAKCQAGAFTFNTVFINPDIIYWGRIIRGAAPIWLELFQSSYREDLKAAGACLAALLAIHGQYMFEFMKTLSSLKQKFFACLPAIISRQASPVLQKLGFRQRGLEQIA